MDDLRGLSCSVCYNPFKATNSQAVPRNLNCGHTYCTACLGKLSSQCQYAFVRCPACKHETLLMSRFNGISSLPKNFGVLEIIEGKETHGKQSVGAAMDLERAKNKYQCDEHDEPKKVYCYTDQTLICIYCQIYGNHQGHKCELASKLATSVKEGLRKVSQKLGDEHKKMCQAKQAVVSRKNAIKQNQYSLKEQISTHVASMKGMLCKRELELKRTVDEMTNLRISSTEAQERSLTEIISKCEQLYILMQKVQQEGDGSIVESKSEVDSLISEISTLSEECELTPQAKNNLTFQTELGGLFMIHAAVGELKEAAEIQEEAEAQQNPKDTHEQNSERESLMSSVLEALQEVINDTRNNNTRLNNMTEILRAQQTEQEEESSGTEEESEEESQESGTENEEEDGEEEEEEEEEEDEEEEEEEEEEEDIEEREETEEHEVEPQGAEATVAREEVVSSTEPGELVGAVGGASPSAAIQTLETKRKNDSKQGLLRELQIEIERLKLLGPRGDLIRVLDDSSSSSEEEEEGEQLDSDDSSSDNEAPSLQLDFKIRVNNEPSRNRSSRPIPAATTSSAQALSTQQGSRDSLRSPRMRCSVSNCQYHVNAVLQCKNCRRVFCRQCAPASLICNRSQNGHAFVKYKSQSKNTRSLNNRRLGRGPYWTKPKNAAAPKRTSTPREGNPPRSISLPWQCQRCTMINEGNVLVCGMCLTPKDYDPAQIRIVCPMCTLVNEPGKTSCELCSSALESHDSAETSTANTSTNSLD